jgi:transposase
MMSHDLISFFAENLWMEDTMKPTRLLHKILEESHAVKHKSRLNSLSSAVASVLNGSDLSLTSLGRHMQKAIKPRCKIQEINYLLSNGHLHNERLDIYASINQWLIGQEKLLFILVDWSCVVAHQHHLLRASLLRKGRSVTIYEEIHPENKLGQGAIHQGFLSRLKSVLPKDVEVCIIVDAGFRTDFFVQVQSNDWDYIGRVLSNMHYTLAGKEDWQPCPNLYEQAPAIPEAIGKVKLAKTNRLASHLYLYKKIEEEAQKSGDTKVRKVKHGRKEKEYRNAAKKPWLIASSFDISAEKIMAIYRQRMKIEHDFRDLKDPKWGLGLRESRCTNPMRLVLQLLIGFLASFLLWLIGLCIEKKGLHRDFQANSIKHKRVISLVFLALEALRSGYGQRVKLSDFLELKRNGLQDEIITEILN